MAAVKPEKPEEPGVLAAVEKLGDKRSSVTDISERKPRAEIAQKTADSSEQLKNPTKRIVDEMVLLMGEVAEGRAELLARGVPFHTTNVMVEFGVQGKLEELAKIRATALEGLEKNNTVESAITAKKLEEHLDTLVNLEKDLGTSSAFGASARYEPGGDK